MSQPAPRDHGGGVDAARALRGGTRADWADLSTGINPHPYPLPEFEPGDWTDLPDMRAVEALTSAARSFWQVPEGAALLAAPGASALIARIPSLAPAGQVWVPGPTYNEHAAAFAGQGWQIAGDARPDAPQAAVLVHPNNPDGRIWRADALRGIPMAVIDESFADTAPQNSLIDTAPQPGRIILKSFGKFWGLAGLRLGFAIGDPELVGRLAELLGPWPVSGAALRIGAVALSDTRWADKMRARLDQDSARLDRLMHGAGATVLGGTSLFRLYDTPDASRWQDGLARHRIWSRVFPYSARWLRLGLPGSEAVWTRLETALEDLR